MTWNEGDHSGLVQLPDGRSLYLAAAGPKRPFPQTPAIIIEHGLGGTRFEWLEVQRRVAKFARVYVYERAGYEPSDAPPEGQSRTARAIAADLKALLDAAGVAPPYVLVGHSLGGLLVRQFLVEYGPDVVSGLVIVDSAVIRTAIPDSFGELFGGTTAGYAEGVGMDVNHTIPEDEWAIVCSDNPALEDIQNAECRIMDEEGVRLKERLGDRQALGDHGRLSVIYCDEANDVQKVYDYALKHGYGSEKAREETRKRLEDMSVIDEASMKAHLTLASKDNGRLVKAQGKQKTHNVALVDPGFVAGEIEWVWSG